ncbi:MAG: MSHA biogenesis protein MshG [Gammaproteobacteria bacterium]|nr:MAG: MSHA biogenesis protein MshG [Gammaproteobacteria bacterium]
MTLYHYTGRSASGDAISGELEAANEGVVATRLQGQNIIPIKIKVHKAEEEKKKKVETGSYFDPKVTSDHLNMFCRQMYALTRSGIPLVTAINGLADSSSSPTLTRVLREVVVDLTNGNSLSSSLMLHKKIFSHLFVSLVHVGESTGKLDEAFKKLVAHIELEAATRKRVKSALRYPMIVFTAMGGAMMVINLFVIPTFAKVFESFDAELPVPTKILMATSEFTVNYWWVILSIVTGAIISLRSYKKTDRGELMFDRLKLRIPLVGKVLKKIALARFTRSFAMLSASGVPVVQSIKITCNALGNRYISESIATMSRGIEQGDTLTNTAAATKMFTPLILQMISVGEETGSLDRLLDDVSDFYEQEIDYDLKMLADSIEPIMLVFMGGMVLILALGVFLPMWELTSVVN